MTASKGTAAEPARKVEPPLKLVHLQGRITRAAKARGVTVRRTQVLVGNVVVAQMLPGGVVKGGSMLKLRFGDMVTRETPDLDTAFRGDVEAFTAQLQAKLSAGWAGFTGRVVVGSRRGPDSVPVTYTMQPLDVKLSFQGKSFMTVELEVGYDGSSYLRWGLDSPPPMRSMRSR